MDGISLIFDLAGIYLLSFLTCSITGLLIGGFLLEPKSPSWSFTPVMGLAAIASFYSALFILRLPLNLILPLHGILLTATTCLSYRTIILSLRIHGKRLLILGSLSFLCYLFLCYPLFSGGGSYPLSRSGDPEFYCALTDFLMDHRFPPGEPENVNRLIEIQQFYLNTGFRLGFNAFHAMISRLYGAASYLIFQPIVAFGWSLFVFPVFCFFQMTRPGSSPQRNYLGVLCFAVLLTSNVAIFTHAAEGAASASMGLLFLFTAFLTLPGPLFHSTLDLKNFCMAGLILTALMSTYTIILVYFLLTLTTLLVMNRRRLKSILFIGSSLALNPVGLIWFSKWLILVLGIVLGQRAGELWLFASPDEWLGLHHYDFGSALPVALRWCATLLSILLACRFFFRSQPEMRSLFFSMLLPFALAFIFTLWIQEYPYAYYKNMVFFAPLGIFLIAGGITDDA